MALSPLTSKDLKKLGIVSPTSPKTVLANSGSDSACVKDTKDIKGNKDGNTSEQNSLGEAEKIANAYLGALEYNDEPLRQEGFHTIDYPDASFLVSFYNQEIAKGNITLFPWQHDILFELGKAKCDEQHTYKFALCAANGSGKDAFIIAPFAVWHALCRKQSRTIITSASGNQLSTQTETYIRNLCKQVNDYHGEEIFRIRQRYIYCRLSGSEIRLFATDEEGKAEGYHPITPGASFAIIVNEAKSVAQEIFRALRRCTGYSYWLDVSSPGAPFGDFYDHFTNWKNKRQVSYIECPNHNEDERLEDLVDLGEHDSLYRSKWMALFTTVEGNSIIPRDVLERGQSLAKTGSIVWDHKDWIKRIGIDLAAGGDENSMYCVQGNKVISELHFRQKDTTITALQIDAWLRGLGIEKKHEHIFADDGGVGKGIIDQLVSTYNWTIRRCNNQSPASNKKQYINRGAQNWYQAKKIFEQNLFYFPFEDSQKNENLFTQLCSRFYKQQSTQGRIALESKAEAKANGRPSPDRADALILCLTGLTPSDYLDDSKKEKGKEVESARSKLMADKEVPKLHSIEAVEDWHQEDRYKNYQEAFSSIGKGKPIRGSIKNYINQRMKGARDVRYN